jgi:hypothetical protein
MEEDYGLLRKKTKGFFDYRFSKRASVVILCRTLGGNMAYWHWGVNFNGHPHGHYRYMLEHGIVLGSSPDTNYQPGDYVAIHKGEGLLAVAHVLAPNEPLQNWNDFQNLVANYGCVLNLDPTFARASFKKVFPVQQGAGEVANQDRRDLIQLLSNSL